MDEFLCSQIKSATPDGSMDHALQQAHAAAKIAKARADVVAAAAALGNSLGARDNGSLAGPRRGPPKKPGPMKKLPSAAAAAAVDAVAAEAGAAGAAGGAYTMWELYTQYWLPFGNVLSSLESEGVRVDR